MRQKIGKKESRSEAKKLLVSHAYHKQHRTWSRLNVICVSDNRNL